MIYDLTNEEKIKYRRNMLIQDWGEDKQKELKGKTVFVAGAGGSASFILPQLVMLGIGNIKIADYDKVDLSNANRQMMHFITSDNRLGMNKALSAAKTLYNLNSRLNVEIIENEINDDNVDELVGNADLIFDTVDNFQTKFILSKCAVNKGIPNLSDAQIDINSFSAVFHSPYSPCFHCIFDEERIELAEMFAQQYKEKFETPVCCPPVAMSCSFSVVEALKLLIDIGKPAYNKFFLFLQKGQEKLKETEIFQAFRFWFTDYFIEKALDQQINFDGTLWRGNFIEEINITKNPNCKNCSQR